MQTIFNWLKNTISGSRKGIEDVIVSMIPQVATAVAGFIASVLIARGLGPQGMGNYALILSVSGLAAALSDLGIGQTAIRFASRAAANNDTDNQLAILRWAFRLRMILVFLTSTIAFIAAPLVADKFWHDSSLSPLVRLSLLTGVFTAIAAVPTIYLQSLKLFKMNAAVIVGQTIVSLAGIVIIAVLKKWSLNNVIIASVVATSLGAITFIVLVPKASFFKWNEFPKQLSESINYFWKAPHSNLAKSPSLDATDANSFAFMMLLSSVIVTLTMRADVWLMGLYVEKSQIGLYSVASRLTLPLVIVLGGLNTALWPRSSTLNTTDEILTLIKKTSKLSFLVVLAGLIYSILAPMLIPLLFGSNYQSAILLSQWLCIRYCISIATCPIGIIGYSFGLVRLYWIINFIQLLLVILINIALLPRIGALGAVIALISNEILGFIVTLVLIWRKCSIERCQYGSNK